MRNYLKFATPLSLTLAGLLLVAYPPLVSGQTPPPIDLSISPPVAYLYTKPGKTTTHTITIAHTGQAPLEVQPQLYRFSTDGETNQPVIDLNQPANLSFVTLPNNQPLTDSFTLEPGEQKSLTLKFSPPSSLNEELHLSLLLTTFAQSPDETGTGPRVGGSIASNIILRVDKSDADMGQLSIAQIKSPVITDSFRPYTFTAVAQNNGTSATIASGSATIKNLLGEEVATFKIFPDIVLANSSREIRAQMIDSKNGELVPKSLTYNPYLLLGPYTVEIELLPNTISSQYVRMSTFFLGIPISFLILISVGIAMYSVFVLITKKMNA